jgi:hypothetical protein
MDFSNIMGMIIASVISGAILAGGARIILKLPKQWVSGGAATLAIALIGSVLFLGVNLTFGTRSFFKVADSIEDICIALQNDPQTTIDNYSGKFYTVVGPISRIASVSNLVYIFSGPADVAVYTKDERIRNFKNNQIIQATGIMITPMEYSRGKSCRLTLNNATVKYE